jgi:hypothetical protein
VEDGTLTDVTRVYVPATLPTLRLLAGGALPAPLHAHAVTPALREWYLDDDLEELEYTAFCEAVRASALVLADEPATPARRVVLAADVEPRAVKPLGGGPDSALSAVELAEPLALAMLAALHFDDPEATGAVRDVCTAIAEGDPAAGELLDDLEDIELSWYDLSELQYVVGEG